MRGQPEDAFSDRHPSDAGTMKGTGRSGGTRGNPEEISWSVEQTKPGQGSYVLNSVAHT